MTNSSSQIGEELRLAREAAGLTQAAAALLLGVGSQTVSRWERGEHAVKAPDYQRAMTVYRNKRALGLYRLDDSVPRGTSVVAEAPLGDREIDHVVGAVRAAATRYRNRLFHGAAGPELERLKREIDVAVRNGIQLGGDDPHLLDEIAGALVDLLTVSTTAGASLTSSRVEPRVREVDPAIVAPAPRAAKKRPRKGRAG